MTRILLTYLPGIKCIKGEGEMKNINTEKVNFIKGMAKPTYKMKVLSEDKPIIHIDITSLISILKSLDEIEQIVLSLHYEQHLNIKDIGAVIGIEEKKAIEIFEQAMHKIQ
tara:strand:- start:102 stop:434 length:333 start_codon:yes stop_codon:yes gene_type:complete